MTSRLSSSVTRASPHAGAWGLTLLLVLSAWLGFAPTARGFALLGPYAPWMTAEVGFPASYRGPDGDIGGPMTLGEEYRWNIPVVTYGFDQSFLDYFGQGGVDAVEQAIQILNDLPPASSMVLTNYPLVTIRQNYWAESQGCLDLKSFTLSRLLEQMGLAAPARYCFVLRRWDPSRANWPSDWLREGGWVDDSRASVENRNYDPRSQSATRSVNEIRYTWQIYLQSPTEPIVATVALDWSSVYYKAVAEDHFSPGEFRRDLTRDDTGGLFYLYNRTNVNVESLDDSAGPVNNGDAFVRLAPRPGIEKLTFVRHPIGPLGGFLAWTNQFADAYFANGLLATQLVQRVVAQPDFLFSAVDVGFYIQSQPQGPFLGLNFLCRRTATSHWTNGNALNGNPDGDGPGVIQPPITLAFAKPGRYVTAAGGRTSGTSHWFWQWASIETKTNMVVFPGNQTNLTSLTLSTRMVSTNGASVLEWTMFGREGANYRIEGSADLTVWTTNSVITNTNGVFQFSQPADGPQHFFRAILED